MSEAIPAGAEIREARAAARPAYDLIELFFFAYRDFVADPDRILAELGLGRAHHRVLHFVARRPDLPVSELLDLLKITKQSLNRVMKELIERGFVDIRAGTADRRQRLLRPTASGRALAVRLAGVQSRRILRALGGERDGESAEAARRFLAAMIDPGEEARMRRLLLAAKDEPDGMVGDGRCKGERSDRDGPPPRA